MLYLASIWVIPIIVAITFHEAAHGFVAYLLGDETAWRLGRVSFNPLKHIDPVGTILLPGFLLLLHSPFIFGYAKPVPVNFRALPQPTTRHDLGSCGWTYLAVFNLFPLPPLDGGRIAVGVLPDAAAIPLARLEPYGLLILISLLFILPMLGAQMGIDVNIVWRFIARSTDAIIDAIIRLTGNY